MQISEPLISKPIFSEKIWGNNELNRIFNYEKTQPLGEVWLYSPLDGYETVLYGKNSQREYGKVSELFPKFPLLLKLIATSSWLSIQLHPDDTMAKQLENEPWGKSEAWYFLKDKGQIKVSNNNKYILQTFDNNRWDEVLESYEMNKFDSIFIPAGTVHTLGPNSLLLEIQQSSDLTYRLYDWGRPREIHVDKSKKVLNNIHTSYSISRKTKGLCTKYFSFSRFANQNKKGFGVYVNLKSYETIVLPEEINYNFQGEFVEFKLNENGWNSLL